MRLCLGLNLTGDFLFFLTGQIPGGLPGEHEHGAVCCVCVCCVSVRVLSVRSGLRVNPSVDLFFFLQVKYPVAYLESMNTVLHQELIRYNRLLAILRSSLASLCKVIQIDR